MPKINDEKKKAPIEKRPAVETKTKATAAAPEKSGFAGATAALKPKPVAAAKRAAPVVPKLTKFAGAQEPLARALAAAKSVGSGSRGISELGRALEAIKGIVKSTVGSADYVAKGDLATRFGMTAQQKNELGQHAQTDLMEIEAIIDTVSAISEMVAGTPDAALLVDRTMETLVEARSDVGSLARTFGAEGFFIRDGSAAASTAPPPEAAPQKAEVVPEAPAAPSKTSAAAATPAPTVQVKAPPPV